MGELAGETHDPAETASGAPEGVREALVPLPAASPPFPGWDPAGEGRRSRRSSLPDELRPRNRLLASGAEALSSAELLAVLFSAFPGTGDAAALEFAGRLISERGGLHGLLRSSVHELVGVGGIGPAKASALLAAAELGKRMVSERTPDRPIISCPADVDALLRSKMAHLDRERFVVVLLNTKNAVLGTHTASIGTLSSSLVHPREVFRPAIQAGAAAVILVHNHPSGKTEPSREDREVTRRLVEAGETIGIEVLDHVVIADSHFSLKEHGLL
jgi:DNA repair protein RadC